MNCRTLLPGLVGLLSLTYVSAAGAQLPPQFAAPGTPKEYQELMVAMTAAQAKANRPGDDAMTCPAIEKELLTSVNDPAIQTYAAKAAGIAEKQAIAATGSKAPTTAQGALALLGGLGAGDALSGGMAAPLAGVAQMKALLPIMPQMMRAQRLVGLAAMRSCPWIFGAYAGDVAPPVPTR
jgi:hypothetical protein